MGKSTDDHENSILNTLLEEEVDKYNRIKSQKQKEAKFLYLEEIKKLKILQNLKEKEDRIEKMTEKMSIDKVYFYFKFKTKKNL